MILSIEQWTPTDYIISIVTVAFFMVWGYNMRKYQEEYLLKAIQKKIVKQNQRRI